MNSTLLRKESCMILAAALLAAPGLIQAQHRFQPAQTQDTTNKRTAPARTEAPAPRAERPQHTQREERPSRPAQPERPVSTPRAERPASSEVPHPPSHHNSPEAARPSGGSNSNERHSEPTRERTDPRPVHTNPDHTPYRSHPQTSPAPVFARPAVVRDSGRGITIQRGPAATRIIETKRPDGTRVVSLGKSRGFLERPIAGRSGYVSRTYVANGRTYARAYRTDSFRGFAYHHYIPRIYYQPLFYTWAFNPWVAPVYFNWGWEVAPWSSYYGPYFRPARVYASSALWLTDFLLAENLKLAYENQQQAGESMLAGDSSAALSPEIKQLIAAQVKQELDSERSAAAATRDRDEVFATRSEAGPEVLNPARRVFVVSMGLDLDTQANQACSLTPGDIILRGGDSVDSAGQVAVTVLASKPGNCPVNSVASVDLATLQEMHNQFREHIDSGLSMLAVNQGKGGLPNAPAAAPRLVNAGMAEPDAAVTSVLMDQQQAADQIEAEARGSSVGAVRR